MTENSNRILVFITAFRPLIGGAEIALEEISKRLPHFHFDIVTPRYGLAHPAQEEISPNITVHRSGSKLSFIFKGLAKAKELHSRYHYRVIHAYQASFGGLVARRFKIQNPEIKFILTIQEGKNLNNQSFLIKKLRSSIISAADRITAISAYLTEYVRLINHKVKITLIPNGVDFDVFKRVDSSVLRKQLGIDKDDKVIITTSRLVYKNGIDRLIEAAGHILSGGARKIKLVIVGTGPLEDELRQKAKKNGIADRVVFAGSVPYREVAEYLSLADVFVRPSRSEGLGTAFLEAMAVGLPVIGTPVGGIPDFIVDKDTGFFWKENEGNLASKILEVLDSEILRTKVALNGQRLVFERYGWDSIARAFNNLYLQEIL